MNQNSKSLKLKKKEGICFSLMVDSEEWTLLIWALRPSSFLGEPGKLQKQAKDLQKKLARALE